MARRKGAPTPPPTIADRLSLQQPKVQFVDVNKATINESAALARTWSLCLRWLHQAHLRGNYGRLNAREIRKEKRDKRMAQRRLEAVTRGKVGRKQEGQVLLRPAPSNPLLPPPTLGVQRTGALRCRWRHRFAWRHMRDAICDVVVLPFFLASR